MDQLTDANMKTTLSQVHPDKEIHASAIAYIQALLTPYAEAMNAATNTAQIRDWLTQALPNELAAHARSTMIKANTEAGWKFVEAPDRRYNDPAFEAKAIDTYKSEEVVVAKNAVIEYLVAELLEISGYKADKGGYGIINPWHVLAAITGDDEFRTLFGYTENMQTLPVQVTYQNKTFNIELTMEQALGILLFSFASNIDFHMMIWNTPLQAIGVPLEEQIFFLDPNIAAAADVHEKYAVRPINAARDFGFNTPEFMQGFATGAMWAGVDHHNYLAWIHEYIFDPNTGEPLDTRNITF